MISVLIAFVRSCAGLLCQHRNAHAVLACAYAAMMVILALEAAYAHAACALVVALVYAALSGPPGGPKAGAQG